MKSKRSTAQYLKTTQEEMEPKREEGSCEPGSHICPWSKDEWISADLLLAYPPQLTRKKG